MYIGQIRFDTHYVNTECPLCVTSVIYCNRNEHNRVNQVLTRSQQLLMHIIPETGIARIQSQDLKSWNVIQKERERRNCRY